MRAATRVNAEQASKREDAEADGRMLGLIKAWLEMPVEEDDGKGGKRLSNRARRERKGTPQGSPISPLASNLYMRRFVLGWKALGHARRYCSEIVNYADDFCVVGKAPAAEMPVAVKRLMDRLKLPINEQKTRCLRCPEEPIDFLGHRIGRNYGLHGRPYIGTRPSKASVQSICRRISEQTAAQHGTMRTEDMVKRLNWMISGWANYYHHGQVGPACLLGHQQPFDETAATVALPEAQGEKREVRALPEPPAVETLRPDLP